jgi:hypothetical protein
VRGTSLFVVCPLFARVEEDCELAKNKVGTEKGEMHVVKMVVGESEWHRLFGGLAVYEKMTLKWISDKNFEVMSRIEMVRCAA